MVDQPQNGKASPLRPLLFLLLLIVLVFLVRVLNLDQYLEKERLRQFVAGYGVWGPIIYFLVWSLAPVLFLPCLPITITGGVLFGPFWGLVYTAFGATSGGTLSFLVARYLARDWVAQKLAGTKLLYLDEKVAQQGWEIVAFTRLVPIFPFFLVNYAFGLTRIPLKHFVLATFFGMIPLTAAFVYFSANVLDLLQGKVSKELLLGVAMVALVSMIPFVYKMIKARRGESSGL